MPKGCPIGKDTVVAVKKLRAKYPRMTQVDLAKLCDTSDTTVSKILQGKHDHLLVDKPISEKPHDTRLFELDAALPNHVDETSERGIHESKQVLRELLCEVLRELLCEIKVEKEVS